MTTVFAVDLLVVAVAMIATAVWSHRVQRFAVIDAAWGATYILVALVGALVAHAGDPWRRWLVTALVVVWGARLARHLFTRVSSSWWGVWLAGALAAGPVPALVTVWAPLLMTWLLAFGSGARLTDRRMKGRPGWDAYAARTPMFLPRPPRRGQRRAR